jgi:hypothetical protein
MEVPMRTASVVALAASLFAAPAMAQVVIQTPNGDAANHEMRADQDRADARAEHQAAQANAAMGNYGAAAQDQAAARHDWHAANHQDQRAAEDSGTAVVIGR